MPAAVENPSVIVMAGLAGGLDPSLKVADLVLDDAGGLVRSEAIRRGADLFF